MSKLRVFLEMIKFEHSVFALPFALAACFLATAGRPGSKDLLWVVLAMVGATSHVLQDGIRRFADHPLVGEATGIGMLAVAELVADKETKEPLDKDPIGKIIIKP